MLLIWKEIIFYQKKWKLERFFNKYREMKKCHIEKFKGKKTLEKSLKKSMLICQKIALRPPQKLFFNITASNFKTMHCC